MISLGGKLRYFRKKNNMTQKKLGDICGVSPKAISRYENGLSQPDLELLKKLAKLYHVDLNYLMGFKHAFKEGLELSLSGYEVELIQNFRKTPRYVQSSIGKFMKEMTYLEKESMRREKSLLMVHEEDVSQNTTTNYDDIKVKKVEIL